MKNTQYKLKSYVKYTLYIFFSLCLFFITVYSFYRTYTSKIVEKITYSVIDNIDYKVYLKDNNFFETPYLEKDSTYISSLIKYIDVVFEYETDYSKPISGKYSYYVEATLLANKADDQEKNYWSKSYKITDIKEFEINNQDHFEINSNVKIDYQLYNNLLTGFKKEYNLPIDGVLKVQLVVESEVKNDKITKSITNKSHTYMEMPLTQASVDIGIKTSSVNNETKQIVENNYELSNRYRMISYLFTGITLVVIGLFIVNIRNDRRKTKNYHAELRKILATYDGIIVNVEHLQDLSKYNIINVASFNELIDAHSEVRMPINYLELEKDQESIFILINNNIAWVYRLTNK